MKPITLILYLIALGCIIYLLFDLIVATWVIGGVFTLYCFIGVLTMIAFLFFSGDTYNNWHNKRN